MDFYYVYILHCLGSNTLYTGYTTDLKERMIKHKNGDTKTTRDRGPIELLYSEAYTNESDARRRELFLKSGRGREILRKQLEETLKNAGII